MKSTLKVTITLDGVDHSSERWVEWEKPLASVTAAESVRAFERALRTKLKEDGLEQPFDRVELMPAVGVAHGR